MTPAVAAGSINGQPKVKKNIYIYIFVLSEAVTGFLYVCVIFLIESSVPKRFLFSSASSPFYIMFIDPVGNIIRTNFKGQCPAKINQRGS